MRVMMVMMMAKATVEVMVKMVQMMLAMTIRQSITIRKMPRPTRVPLPPPFFVCPKHSYNPGRQLASGNWQLWGECFLVYFLTNFIFCNSGGVVRGEGAGLPWVNPHYLPVSWPGHISQHPPTPPPHNEEEEDGNSK